MRPSEDASATGTATDLVSCRLVQGAAESDRPLFVRVSEAMGHFSDTLQVARTPKNEAASADCNAKKKMPWTLLVLKMQVSRAHMKMTLLLYIEA